MKLVFIIAFLLFFLSSKSQKSDTIISIYFENNSYQINPHYKQVLQNTLNKNVTIQSITGFTDSVGQIQSNLVLAQNRLQSTARILQELNINLDTIKVINAGEEVLPNAALFLSRRVDIKVNGLTSKQVPEENVVDESLVRLKLRQFNSIENFHFEPDKAILTQDSYQYVDELYNILKNSNMKFEIIGHVNYQSVRDKTFLKSLYDLSSERAKAIYDLLNEKGIPSIRMTYRGVGNSQPIFSNPKSEEEKRKNMRVEIIPLN